MTNLDTVAFDWASETCECDLDVGCTVDELMQGFIAGVKWKAKQDLALVQAMKFVDFEYIIEALEKRHLWENEDEVL